MNWMGFILGVTSVIAWPACIAIVIVVLKRSWSNAQVDEAIAALSPSIRDALRTTGITVYPSDSRSGKVMLDHPITSREMRGFDRRHPGFDVRYADQ